MIYDKKKEYLQLTLYGYNDAFRDNVGNTTKNDKNQISSILTPYITDKYSQYFNSKIYRFYLDDKLTTKQLPQNSKINFNILTLPVLQDVLTPHHIILKLLNTNDDNRSYNNLSQDNSVIISNYSYDQNSAVIINPLTTSDTTTTTNVSTTNPITNITTNTTTITRTITIPSQTEVITTVNTSSSDFSDFFYISGGGVEDINPLKVLGDDNDWYYVFTDTFFIYSMFVINNFTCDVLLVGGGGNGGQGNYSGGGGAGEVVVKKNYTFTFGSYEINVGDALQYSSISENSTNIFLASKGGDGGSFLTFTTNVVGFILPPNSFYRINGSAFLPLDEDTYYISFNAGAIQIISLVDTSDVDIIDKSYPIVNSPMAWYKFDVSGAANLGLDSQGTYNLTAYNIPTIDTTDNTKGIGSVVFNGTNYFEIANTGQFSPDSFSICCWCKIVQKSGYQSITSCRSQVSTNWFGWMVYVNNNNLEFFTGIGANGFSNSGGAYNNFAASTPIWRHLVITMNKATNTAIIYINSVLHASVSRTYANNTGTNMRIGCGNNNGTAFEFLANGSKIDDFRFYNRVLTAAEISLLYTGSVDIYTLPSLNGGGAGSMELKYPPTALTATTTVISNQTYGNGTYITSSSSEISPGEVSWKAFDSTSSGFGWTIATNGRYYLGDYVFSPPFTTVVSGVSYTGEWLQIQFSFSFVLTKYQLYTWESDMTRAPKLFVIAGSNDGITWSLVDYENNITGWTTAGKIFYANNTTPYKYYRLVVNKNNGGGRLSVGEWLLYEYIAPQNGGIATLTDTNPPGSVSYFGNGANGVLNQGGKGGEISEHSYNIYGTALDLAYGGDGGNLTSFPLVKTKYGSGGDAKFGAGSQGIVVFRFKNLLTETTSTTTITIYQETTLIKNENNFDLLNSFSIPSTFFNRGYIDFEISTFSNYDITFNANQLNRLIINAIVYEPKTEITKDVVLASAINHKSIAYSNSQWNSKQNEIK